MNNFELIKEKCYRCQNCNSSIQLEIHHRIFKSELDYGVKKNIEDNRKIFEETWGKNLGEWGIDDIQNLVLLCAYCHKERIHKGDIKLRNFFRNSFTDPTTFLNIPFKKPIKTLF